MNAFKLLISSAVLAAGGALAGCGQSAPAAQADTSVVLIDGSGSIEPADRLIYEQSLSALGAELGGGDRMLIGPVGESGRSEFRPQLDLTVPRTNIRVDQEHAVRSARTVIAQALPRLFSDRPDAPAQRTRLVEAIAAAAEAFGPPPHHGDRLVLLSDGVEDSPFGRLDQIGGEREIEAMLDHMRSAGLLPDLRGLSISVVGAGGEDYAQVRRFWEAYAASTGASIVSYGRLPYRAPRAGEGP